MPRAMMQSTRCVRNGWLLASCLAMALGAAPRSHAQTGGDKASAEALFSDGRRLMAAGNYVEACPKFATSQKLDPGLGTLLNLADCYDKLGRSATAWGLFREVAGSARAAGDTRREQAAKQRADALEPKLSRLTFKTPPNAPADLTVKRDDVSIDAAVLSTPLPVDPGEHAIEVSARGKKTWRTTITVPAGAALVPVEIPALEDEPVGGGLPATTHSRDTYDSTGQTEIPYRPRSGQRTIALVVGGVGVAALITGGVLGLSARSKWNDANSRCPGKVCESSDDVQLGNDAKSRATWATVAFGVGAAGLIAGGVLWFTAPKQELPARASVRLSPMAGQGASGLWLDGRF